MLVRTKTKTILTLLIPFAFLILVVSLGTDKLWLFYYSSRMGNGDYDATDQIAYFQNDQLANLVSPVFEPSSVVLGASNPDQKLIEVDLSEQKLTAWQGSEKVLESLVSTGKWNKTPAGRFRIWGKYKYQKMSGGNKELHTYYYLPNVPYTMFFYKDFGLHGTYWHNNFGTPMSHGCVNLPTPVAEKLFYWAEPSLPTAKRSVLALKPLLGTEVYIHQ